MSQMPYQSLTCHRWALQWWLDLDSVLLALTCGARLGLRCLDEGWIRFKQQEECGCGLSLLSAHHKLSLLLYACLPHRPASEPASYELKPTNCTPK